MIRVDTSEPAFTGGEMSPLVLGRHDTERFLLGGEIIENFVARHQGPLVRRRGTQYVRGVDESICAAARLFDFEFSRDDSEMLQFGCGEVVIGAVEPAPPPIPVTTVFESYDGPFTFPPHLLTDDDPENPIFYRSAFISGENAFKCASIPNNPSGQPCSIGGVINGLCETVFSGGYQMFVDDPTTRDPVTGDPVTDPLICDVTLKGRIAPYNIHPNSGDTYQVGSATYSGLSALISGVGGGVMPEAVYSYHLADQFVQKFVTVSDPGGYYVGNFTNLIWCIGKEIDYRFTNPVEPEDLP